MLKKYNDVFLAIRKDDLAARAEANKVAIAKVMDTFKLDYNDASRLYNKFDSKAWWREWDW